MPSLVFAGAGLSSLSLVMRLIDNGFADKHKIILYDRDRKLSNDRTWCFWEQGEGFFEELLHCQWPRLQFYGPDFDAELSIAPYRYKMIRGIDFYTSCLSRIKAHPNIEMVIADIKSMRKKGGKLQVEMADGSEDHYEQAIGFNSIPTEQSAQKGDITLLQHFKGWIIETEEPRFETDKATLMDFRINQQPGTSFVYVLPVSEKQALIEYTLFTETLLSPDEYDKALRDYCSRFLGLGQYRVLEEEWGVIPMTNKKFPRQREGIIQLGTAGGQTKASSGYTFQFIQKQSARLAEALLQGKEELPIEPDPWRFRFYDDTLLYVLHHRLYPGDKVFTRLFQRNPAKRVLRFLDNESSLSEELLLLTSLPTWPFLKAAIRKRRSY